MYNKPWVFPLDAQLEGILLREKRSIKEENGRVSNYSQREAGWSEHKTNKCVNKTCKKCIKECTKESGVSRKQRLQARFLVEPA